MNKATAITLGVLLGIIVLFFVFTEASQENKLARTERSYAAREKYVARAEGLCGYGIKSFETGFRDSTVRVVCN